MANTKKPAAKTTAKKPAAKKTATKAKSAAKAAAKKPPIAHKKPEPKTAAKKASARPAPKTTTKAAAKTAKRKDVIADFPTDLAALAARRPPNNPELPADFLRALELNFIAIRDELTDYSAHLRSLDRMRLNGVGLKKLGFIERALLLAAENPEFLPHYVTLQKFQNDNNYYLSIRSAYDVVQQLQEILWNLVIEASDVIYTDALEYYAGVREAAKRRVDPAETLYKDLHRFFKREPQTGGEPTEKQLKRDVNALIKGKKDGKVVIENVRPKLTGGERKVVDETFKDTAEYKETEEGSFKE